MSFLEDTPLLSTGSKEIDGACAMALFAIVCVAILTVLDTFRVALKVVPFKERDCKKEIYLFLLLAVVALVGVNSLRFEHRRLEIASWDQIDSWKEYRRLPDAPSIHEVSEGAKGIMSNVKEGLDSAHHAASNLHMPASREEAVDEVRKRIPSTDDVVHGFAHVAHDIGEGISHLAGGIKAKVNDVDAKVVIDNISLPKALHDRFSWMPSWYTRNSTVFDFFKLLVDKYRYFWWTQQWLTGYAAWAMFVGMKCYKVEAPTGVSASFILLGYVFSLAGMQCLFFSYLLLLRHQENMGNDGWIPSPQWMFVAPILVQSIGTAALPAFLSRGATQGDLRAFNVLQVFLACWPGHYSTDACIRFDDRMVKSRIGRRGLFTKEYQKRMSDIRIRVVSLIWFSSSVFMLVLFWFAAVSAMRESAPVRRSSWLYPISGQEEGSIHRLMITISQIFGSFSEHPWIGAIGWDIILSTCALSMWAYTTDANVRGMIKCTLFPWLEEAIGAVKEKVEQVGEAVDPYAKATLDNMEHVRRPLEQYARQGLAAVKQTADESSAWLEEHDLDLKSTTRRVSKAASAFVEDLSHERNREGYDWNGDWQKAAGKKLRTASPSKGVRGRREDALPVSKRRSQRSKSRRSEPEPTPQQKRTRSATRSGRLQHGQRRDEGSDLTKMNLPMVTADGTEAMAITWVLSLIGGLGFASAGVYGAEELELRNGRGSWM